MHSALSKWPLIQKGLQKAEFVYIFLDYDGTLTPIVLRPENATLSDVARNILQELSKVPQYKVAIVSGRALHDIKSMVGLRKLVYVGNHGYEVDGEDLKFASLVTPQLRTIFSEVREAFDKKTRRMEGAWIEDKGVTLSVHYRQLVENKVPVFKRTVRKILEPYLKEKAIRCGQGKKVIEVRPFFEWDKGKVVLWLLKQQQFATHIKNILPVYIGDDITDEDVFLALRKKGITIFVGEMARASHAQYCLKDTREVFDFLTKILNVKRSEAYAG